jgi:phospholipid/cholesterol/gamma-HCH transport system permease protein
MIQLIEAIGAGAIRLTEEAGRIAVLSYQTILGLLRRPFNLRLILAQMEEVGAHSLPVVLITALATGAVLCQQSVAGFRRFGAESLVGGVVALSMTRELGPIISGLMVAGRVGSAMAAELGTMRVTEQIDALYTLATDPVKYLIVPRFLAGMLMLPILLAFADGIGILGGYIVGVKLLGINGSLYMKTTYDLLTLKDLFSGFFKAGAFGAIIAMVGCYQGFYTRGGAEGVGQSTTRAVVGASMAILISDYLMNALFFLD